MTQEISLENSVKLAKIYLLTKCQVNFPGWWLSVQISIINYRRTTEVSEGLSSVIQNKSECEK